MPFILENWVRMFLLAMNYISPTDEQFNSKININMDKTNDCDSLFYIVCANNSYEV